MKNIFVTKTDLAQAYFPFIGSMAARHKLMSLIQDDKTLMGELVETGYKTLSHTFSPAQVEIIIGRLGNPFK